MATEQANKSRRESFSERLRTKHPEGEWADDDALFGQINDDYDDYDKQLGERDKEIGEMREREGKLTDMFRSDPRSASLLMGMRDGEDPAIGMMRRFGPEIRDILDDPDKQEELAKAQAEYLERISKEKDLEQQYEKNLAESLTMLEQYQQEKGLSDEQVDRLMEDIIAVANDMVLGKFSRETLDKFSRAQNYEADVNNAGAEGELRGKNARIEEKLRSAGQGDGTARLDGKNRTSQVQPQPNLGALDNFDGGNASIWERGGMKRTKH